MFLIIWGFTSRVSEFRKLLVSLDIGQHNASKIFAVKGNIVSEISYFTKLQLTTLLDDIFAEFLWKQPD